MDARGTTMEGRSREDVMLGALGALSTAYALIWAFPLEVAREEIGKLVDQGQEALNLTEEAEDALTDYISAYLDRVAERRK